MATLRDLIGHLFDWHGLAVAAAVGVFWMALQLVMYYREGVTDGNE